MSQEAKPSVLNNLSGRRAGSRTQMQDLAKKTNHYVVKMKIETLKPRRKSQ